MRGPQTPILLRDKLHPEKRLIRKNDNPTIQIPSLLQFPQNPARKKPPKCHLKSPQPQQKNPHGNGLPLSDPQTLNTHQNTPNEIPPNTLVKQSPNY